MSHRSLSNPQIASQSSILHRAADYRAIIEDQVSANEPIIGDDIFGDEGGNPSTDEQEFFKAGSSRELQSPAQAQNNKSRKQVHDPSTILPPHGALHIDSNDIGKIHDQGNNSHGQILDQGSQLPMLHNTSYDTRSVAPWPSEERNRFSLFVPKFRNSNPDIHRSYSQGFEKELKVGHWSPSNTELHGNKLNTRAISAAGRMPTTLVKQGTTLGPHRIGIPTSSSLNFIPLAPPWGSRHTGSPAHHTNDGDFLRGRPASLFANKLAPVKGGQMDHAYGTNMGSGLGRDGNTFGSATPDLKDGGMAQNSINKSTTRYSEVSDEVNDEGDDESDMFIAQSPPKQDASHPGGPHFGRKSSGQNINDQNIEGLNHDGQNHDGRDFRSRSSRSQSYRDVFPEESDNASGSVAGDSYGSHTPTRSKYSQPRSMIPKYKNNSKIAKPRPKRKGVTAKLRNGQFQGLDNDTNRRMFELRWDNGMDFNEIAALFNRRKVFREHEKTTNTLWTGANINNRYNQHAKTYFEQRGIPYVQHKDVKATDRKRFSFDKNWKNYIRTLVAEFNSNDMMPIVLKRFTDAQNAAKRSRSHAEPVDLAQFMEVFERDEKWDLILKKFNKECRARNVSFDMTAANIKCVYSRILNDDWIHNPIANKGKYMHPDDINNIWLRDGGDAKEGYDSGEDMEGLCGERDYSEDGSEHFTDQDDDDLFGEGTREESRERSDRHYREKSRGHYTEPDVSQAGEDARAPWIEKDSTSVGRGRENGSYPRRGGYGNYKGYGESNFGEDIFVVPQV